MKEEVKIPMKIFQTYEELTEYYKDGVDMELGLYVSEGKLLVGHTPTAYSFNPQYFTGENELMPDYVPESPIDYTITATSNNTTYGYVTGGGTYPQHSEITLNAYAYNGYKFDKWSNGVETSAYTFAVEENANLVGNFVDNTYTVTININIQDSGTMTGAGTYISGTSVTVTATPNEGFIFIGWTLQGSPYIISSNPEYTFILEEDIALMANFDRIYNVSATPNNASYGSTSGSGTYNDGTSATVTATAETGYRFVNWTEDNVEVSTSSSYTFLVYKDTSLVANFELITYTVTVSANDSSYGTVTGGGEYARGSNVTINAISNSGYNFINWTQGGIQVVTHPEYTFTILSDADFVANFGPAANINISANNPTYGSVDAAGSTVIGESYTVIAGANAGYRFVNWTENGTEVSTSSSYTFTVTGDRTLVANFEVNPLAEPFYVENITNANETLRIGTDGTAPSVTVEYSTDKQNWHTLGTTSTTILTRTIAPGERLYLRADTDAWSTPNNQQNYIEGISKVGGNIMSLIYGSNFTGNETTFKNNATHVFAGLFGAGPKGWTLQSAENLILPATTLTTNCYVSMFKNTYITTAPELLATTLPAGCYMSMFYNCNKLNYIKCLATSFGANSLYYWTDGAAAKGTFVKAAGVTWTTGKSGIPTGWTVEEV